MTAAAGVPRPPLRTVLLVEPHADIAELLAHLFRHEGWKVLQTPSLAAATPLLQAVRSIDAAVVDLGGFDSSIEMAIQALAARQPGRRLVFTTASLSALESWPEGCPWPLLRKPYGLRDILRLTAVR